MNRRVLGDTENITSVRNSNSVLKSKQKGSAGLKVNALGDVRNILHSRVINGSTSKTPNLKPRNFIIDRENAYALSAGKFENSKTRERSPVVSVIKNEPLDFHNHYLCEQEDETSFTNFLNDCRLSDKDINTLVSKVKSINIMYKPLKISYPEPCEDIEIIEEKREIEISTDEESLDDSLPEIKPPDGYF